MSDISAVVFANVIESKRYFESVNNQSRAKNNRFGLFLFLIKRRNTNGITSGTQHLCDAIEEERDSGIREGFQTPRLTSS